MTPEQLLELQNQIQLMRQDIEELRYLVSKKTGLGSNDIRGRIRGGSSVVLGTGDINSSGMFGAGVVDQAAVGADAVGDSELKYEEVTVTVLATATTGTGTAASGSVILGWRPNGNVDQFVDQISIVGTTVTVTLGAAATANNNFVVILIKT